MRLTRSGCLCEIPVLCGCRIPGVPCSLLNADPTLFVERCVAYGVQSVPAASAGIFLVVRSGQASGLPPRDRCARARHDEVITQQYGVSGLDANQFDASRSCGVLSGISLPVDGPLVDTPLMILFSRTLDRLKSISPVLMKGECLIRAHRIIVFL